MCVVVVAVAVAAAVVVVAVAVVVAAVVELSSLQLRLELKLCSVVLYSDVVVIVVATTNGSCTSISGPSMWHVYHDYFDMCFGPQHGALCRHLNFQKWSERVVFLQHLLTWKCVRIHFFNGSHAQSAPNMRCFEHVDLKMCFAPRQLATFDL